MKQITAKDVYLFADECLKIQDNNIELIKEALKNAKATNKQKQAYRQAIKIAEEKKDFLENTKTIVLALYERQGKKFLISDEDRQAFVETYLKKEE